MAGKDINIAFYLTIFEKEASEYNPINEYMLRDMAYENFQDEFRTLGIASGIEKSSLLCLQRISEHNSRSKHVIICISGFLTEDVEKSESWKHVINHYKYAEIFALNWNSLSL